MKKRMKKKNEKRMKLLALLFATAMCLSACGNTTGKEESKATGTSGAETSRSTASSEEAAVVKNYWELLNEVSDTSELPDWPGETLEINMWLAGGTGGNKFNDLDEAEVVWKEVERVTGVKINIDECFDNNGQNIDAKLPMVVASGDMPNVIYGYDVGVQMSELYENGYLVDLTPYYEDGSLDQVTHWYPMDNAMVKASIYDNSSAADGSIIGIPFYSALQVIQAGGYTVEEFDPVYYAQYGAYPSTRGSEISETVLWVRDDIVKALFPDALTMDEIEQIYMETGTFTEEQVFDLGLDSAEDFYQFMRDIKELISDGTYVDLNGKPIEVFYGPHTETDNWVWGTLLADDVAGYNDADYFCYWDATATEPEDYLKRTLDNEGYVDYIREINKLVREDVIDKDSFLDNATMQDEKIKSHHYAVTINIWNRHNEEKWAGDGYRYRPIYINVPTAKDLNTYSAIVGTHNYYICKSDMTDEQIEQLVHFFNYLNSEVGLLNSFYGPATAGLFTLDEKGNRTYIDELYQDIILGNDNGAAEKYNVGRGDSYHPWLLGVGRNNYDPVYLAKASLPREVAIARRYYNPGLLESEIKAKEEMIPVAVGTQIYASFGQSNEKIKEFWSARPGFESLLVKLLVAENDDAFDAALARVIEYMDENGFTQDTMKEYSLAWVEANKTQLKAAGFKVD